VIFDVELKSDVDYDSMGPSLQLVGARYLNFLLRKLSHDFKLCRMSILQDFQRAIFLYCLRLWSHCRVPVCWYPICIVHADVTLTRSKVKVMQRWLSAPFRAFILFGLLWGTAAANSWDVWC